MLASLVFVEYLFCIDFVVADGVGDYEAIERLPIQYRADKTQFLQSFSTRMLCKT